MDMEFARASAVMMAINLGYTIVALFVGMVGLLLVDKLLLRKVDLQEEIQRGNVAAAIFAASLVLFIGIVIATALGK
jgi:uncharacterized membrane protein YjfL (UPF0719 family)